MTVVQPGVKGGGGAGDSSPETTSPSPTPALPPHPMPAVCSVITVSPSINGGYYREPLYYTSLPRRNMPPAPPHYTHTLPQYREQTYLMRPPPYYRPPDRYVVPTFSMLGLGEVLQQYGAREPHHGRIISSLATSYAITTSDSDEDLE